MLRVFYPLAVFFLHASDTLPTRQTVCAARVRMASSLPSDSAQRNAAPDSLMAHRSAELKKVQRVASRKNMTPTVQPALSNLSAPAMLQEASVAARKNTTATVQPALSNLSAPARLQDASLVQVGFNMLWQILPSRMSSLITLSGSAKSSKTALHQGSIMQEATSLLAHSTASVFAWMVFGILVMCCCAAVCLNPKNFNGSKNESANYRSYSIAAPQGQPDMADSSDDEDEPPQDCPSPLLHEKVKSVWKSTKKTFTEASASGREVRRDREERSFTCEDENGSFTKSFQEEDHSDKKWFGDWSRGIRAAGKESRGAEGSDHYKLGDFSRGLIAKVSANGPATGSFLKK